MFAKLLHESEEPSNLFDENRRFEQSWDEKAEPLRGLVRVLDWSPYSW